MSMRCSVFYQIGGFAMRSNDRNRRWAAGVGMAAGAAFAAALIGLANAPAAGADPAVVDGDPFQDLFGFTAAGINSWTQGADNFLDVHAPFLATTLDGLVIQFNAADVDPLSDLVAALDPNAFSNGLPTDFLGDLAVTLDYGLLAPTGLAALLDPVIGLPTGLGSQLDPVIDILLGTGMP
jgi:hypothetical protein